MRVCLVSLVYNFEMLSRLLLQKKTTHNVDFKITFGSVMFSHIVASSVTLFAMMEINNICLSVTVTREEYQIN